MTRSFISIFLVPRGITPTKIRGSKIFCRYAKLHMMSYLHTKFHDNWISSFRGVAMTRFWDGRSDCTPRSAFTFGDAGKNGKPKDSFWCFK